MICRRLLFGTSCTRGGAGELDVKRLQFGLVTKVDLEFVEPLAKALNARFDGRFVLLVLLQQFRRGFISLCRFIDGRNATGHTAKQVNKPGHQLNLLRDALRARGARLRHALCGRCR